MDYAQSNNQNKRKKQGPEEGQTPSAENPDTLALASPEDMDSSEDQPTRSSTPDVFTLRTKGNIDFQPHFRSAQGNNSLNLPASPSPAPKQYSLNTQRAMTGNGMAISPETAHTEATLTGQTASGVEEPTLTAGEPGTQRSLLDKLIEAEESGEMKTTNRPNSRDPLEKYTTFENNTEPLTVHLIHPMAALRNMDHDLLKEWEKIPGGKLLAQPFGAYATNPGNHNTLKALIYGATNEITKSGDIKVCAPTRKHNARRSPITFLIFNLTEIQKQTLLIRGVWSSKIITFRVFPMEPACPDFLFTIKGITTLTTDQVKEVVQKVWRDDLTKSFLNTICDQVIDSKKEQALQSLNDFINSLKVSKLDTKTRGNVAAPTFRIYAAGATINEERTWCGIRGFLAAREYRSQFQDVGTNSLPLKECSLCHGADHPRGMCPFPSANGWNGPPRRLDPPLMDPEDMGSEVTRFRDRPRAKVARLF